MSITLVDGPEHVTVVAQRGDHLAVEHRPRRALCELLEFREVLERALSSSLARPSPQALRAFGVAAFEFVFHGSVAQLHGRVSSALPLGQSMALEFLCVGPDLHRVPWEYLLEPGAPLAPSRKHPIIRVVPCPTAPRFSPPKLRAINVLIVFAEPGDQSTVPWAAGVDEIRRNFSASEFEGAVQVIPNATFIALRDALDQIQEPTILQFFGHGSVDDDDRGALLLVDEDRSHPLGAETLAGLIRDLPIPLVVLTACESSAGNPEQPFGAIAQTLVMAGTPAVLAYQLGLPTRTTIAQVKALYEMLLASGDVDDALTSARFALFGDLSGAAAASFEWGIATLHRRPHTSTLFELDDASHESMGALSSAGSLASEYAGTWRVGVWSLDPELQDLFALLEWLETTQRQFEFSERFDPIPAGTIIAPDQVRDWAKATHAVSDAELALLGASTFVDHLFDHAQALQRRAALDALLVVTPSVLLDDRASNFEVHTWARRGEVTLLSRPGIAARTEATRLGPAAAVALELIAAALATLAPDATPGEPPHDAAATMRAAIMSTLGKSEVN